MKELYTLLALVGLMGWIDSAEAMLSRLGSTARQYSLRSYPGVMSGTRMLSKKGPSSLYSQLKQEEDFAKELKAFAKEQGDFIKERQDYFKEQQDYFKSINDEIKKTARLLSTLKYATYGLLGYMLYDSAKDLYYAHKAAENKKQELRDLMVYTGMSPEEADQEIEKRLNEKAASRKKSLFSK